MRLNNYSSLLFITKKAGGNALCPNPTQAYSKKSAINSDEDKKYEPEINLEYKAGKLVTDSKEKKKEHDELYMFYSHCAKYDKYYKMKK